jgi:hypothetical protein
MKVQSAEPTQSIESTRIAKPARLDDAARCRHRSPSGRRCKLPIHRPGELLCRNHQLEYKKTDAFNLQAALLANSQAFQTAQGVNNALRNLYGLLANNYISPRRASVLAYISSLLLRTLPAIDSDNANGITNPTAPAEVLEAVQNAVDATDPAGGEAATTATDSASDESQSETPSAAVTEHASTKASAQTGTWPEGIPEPDAAKKPS